MSRCAICLRRCWFWQRITVQHDLDTGRIESMHLRCLAW